MPEKKQKNNVTEVERVIRLRDMSYEQVKAFYADNDVPFFIDDVPVWLFACRQDNPEFFVVDLERMEERLHAIVPTTSQPDYPYARSLIGVQLVTKNGSPFVYKGKDKVFWRTFNWIVAAVTAPRYTARLSEAAVTSIIMKSSPSKYASLFSEPYGADIWPSFVDDVPTWMYALRENRVAAYVAGLRIAAERLAEDSSAVDKLVHMLQGDVDRTDKRNVQCVIDRNVTSQKFYDDLAMCST
jgi:hypothetical protein